MRRAFLLALVAAVAASSLAGGAGAAERRAAEAITVSNTSAKAVPTTTVLDSDHRYRLTVSGTISDWCTTSSCPAACPAKGEQPNVVVQGVCCYAKWRSATPEAWQQLTVNGQGILDFAGLKPEKSQYSGPPEH